MTFKERIKACYKILLKGKPVGTITYGIRLVKCSDCEYNLKCENCAYELLYAERKDKQ